MIDRLLNAYVKHCGRNVILCFHSIGSEGYSREKFISLIERLENNGYIFPDPDDLGTSYSEKAAYITFDDGYKDNLDIVQDYLSIKKIIPIIFVITNMLQGNISDKQRMGIKNIKHMTIEEAEKFKSLVHFGFHTHNHDNVTTLTACELKESFLQGMPIFNKLLESGRKSYFAYPFGYLPNNQREFNAILNDHSFELAFTTRWGKINRDRYNLNRVVIGDKDSVRKSLLKISGVIDFYAHLRWG